MIFAALEDLNEKRIMIFAILALKVLNENFQSIRMQYCSLLLYIVHMLYEKVMGITLPEIPLDRLDN